MTHCVGRIIDIFPVAYERSKPAICDAFESYVKSLLIPVIYWNFRSLIGCYLGILTNN